MSKRNYEISRKAGDNMWTCKVTSSYGETHTNYFETEKQCREHIYYTWENEVDVDKFVKEDLLSNAIEECVKMDKERGVEPNLD